MSKSQGVVRPEGTDKLKEFIHLIESRILDLAAFRIVPGPLQFVGCHNTIERTPVHVEAP
jgi:hypothetical protein